MAKTVARGIKGGPAALQQVKPSPEWLKLQAARRASTTPRQPLFGGGGPARRRR
jgi:hypothetical protein